ncbi:MAG: hypothetical protein K8S18_05470, partial [Desulfobacula sp.]|nr:hypothetical protein [Desulfobacula sp.]
MFADYTNKPILQINAGMHTAMINRMSIDSSSQMLVTPSDDRTVRIWDLKKDKIVKILRLPVGSSPEEGMPQSVAVSPDGKTVACSAVKFRSAQHSDIYFYDIKNGRIKFSIPSFQDYAFHMVYSKNGRYLAALSKKKKALIIDVINQKTLDVYVEGSWGDFDENGRLITVNTDKKVRLYDPEFNLLKIKKLKNQPYSVDFSPTGDKIAIGFWDSMNVQILSGETFKHQHYKKAPRQIANYKKKLSTGNLMSISWSNDGKYLYASGRVFIWNNKKRMTPIFKWLSTKKGKAKLLIASENTITSILPVKAGGVVYGACDPSWGYFDSNDNRKYFHESPNMDATSNRSKLLFSSDGMDIGFYYFNSEQKPTIFSLKKGILKEENASNMNLLAPLVSKSGMKITDWRHKKNLKFNRKKITTYDRDKETRCLAISKNGEWFVAGTMLSLILFDNNGKEIWRIATPDETWGVNISENNKYILANFNDGTIRWYLRENGAELINFYSHRDKKRWVIWTPEGFFDHSPGGEKLIGYHINQGKRREAEFINIDQLYDHYYRPDLVRKKVEGGHKNEIKDELAKIINIRSIVPGDFPPKIEIISPLTRSDFEKRDITVKIKVTDIGGGIGRVIYRINGVTIGMEDHGRGIKIVKKVDEEGISTIIEKLITLQPGDNHIVITAYNQQNNIESKPASISLFLKDTISEKPILYVLSIGINDYRDRSLKLNFAVTDALAVSDELKTKGEHLFKQVLVEPLAETSICIRNNCC